MPTLPLGILFPRSNIFFLPLWGFYLRMLLLGYFYLCFGLTRLPVPCHLHQFRVEMGGESRDMPVLVLLVIFKFFLKLVLLLRSIPILFLFTVTRVGIPLFPEILVWIFCTTMSFLWFFVIVSHFSVLGIPGWVLFYLRPLVVLFRLLWIPSILLPSIQIRIFLGLLLIIIVYC